MKFGRKYDNFSSYPIPHKIIQIQADTTHSLPRNQVPEWASAYINYKGLKKLIKAAAQASKNGEQVDLAGKAIP